MCACLRRAPPSSRQPAPTTPCRRCCCSTAVDRKLTSSRIDLYSNGPDTFPLNTIRVRISLLIRLFNRNLVLSKHPRYFLVYQVKHTTGTELAPTLHRQCTWFTYREVLLIRASQVDHVSSVLDGTAPSRVPCVMVGWRHSVHPERECNRI